jgi:hypothetical protein
MQLLLGTNKNRAPFEEKERDSIVAYFRQLVYGHRKYLGLCWGDVDLRHAEISISKSRYLEEQLGTRWQRAGNQTAFECR